MTQRRAPTVIRLKRKRASAPAEPKAPYHLDAGPPAEVRPIEAENPVKLAETILGKRLTYSREGARLLDGFACTLDELMRAANRIRKAQRLLLLGRKKEWRV